MKKVMVLVIWGGLAMASLSVESLRACLDEDFKVTLSHKAFPLGLFSRDLTIAKKRCEMKIQYVSYYFIKKSWKVDVCRGPVHIKEGIYSVEVLKRKGRCLGESSPYCQAFQKIKKMIQDDGLIFAKGEKEDIFSEHGRVYCAYALINKYLAGGEILSRYWGPGPYRSHQKAIPHGPGKKSLYRHLEGPEIMGDRLEKIEADSQEEEETSLEKPLAPLAPTE